MKLEKDQQGFFNSALVYFWKGNSKEQIVSTWYAWMAASVKNRLLASEIIENPIPSNFK
jgi:hypothetical protein